MASLGHYEVIVVTQNIGIIIWNSGRQYGHHFKGDIFSCIFMNEKFRILIQISLKFVLKSQIDSGSILFQVMAWHLPGDRPLPEPMLIQFTDAHNQGVDEMTWFLLMPCHLVVTMASAPIILTSGGQCQVNSYHLVPELRQHTNL